MANKKTVEKDAIRDKVLDSISDYFENKGEEVLQIATNTLCFPFVFANGDEGYCRIVVSIPSGARGDTGGFDGHDQAEQFKQKQADKIVKAKEKEVQKQKKIAQDKAFREAKAKEEQT